MTLSQAAVYTRKGIIIFGALVFVGIIFAIGLNIWRQYEIAHRKPVEEKPEMRFGTTLPKIKFPPSKVSSSNYAYTLDTTTGNLPSTPKIIKIYFIPLTGISLMDPNKAKKMAEKLGFPGNPETLSTVQYKFTNNNGGNMTINITTGNFQFQKPVVPAEKEEQRGAFPSNEQITNEFKQYLSSQGLMTVELSTGKTNVTFIKAGDLDVAEISIWPAYFDKLPIVTPQFTSGLVKATMTKYTSSENKFTDLNYTFWAIDKTSSSTYPLKTAQQAFTDLKNGEGFVSIEPKSPQASISNIYLAYYQSEEYTPYMQPVFVFEGPEFTAIVPAVADSATIQPTTTQR